MKINLLFICVLLPLLPCKMKAQTTDNASAPHTTNGWYVGVQGAVPFGVSNFTSFGADKTHFGWATGAFAGYRFNPLLSLELSAKVGQTTLAVHKNDVNANYWLGSDMVRYHAPVIDMVGWDYNNLTSQVNFKQYGLQLNVNVPSFFYSDSECRWILELSPAVSAMRTRADFITIADNAEVVKGETQWHMGVGGNVQIGYQITNHLGVGIYGGITHLLGNRYDKLPKHSHKTNYIFESGLKLTWTLGTNFNAKKQTKEDKR